MLKPGPWDVEAPGIRSDVLNFGFHQNHGIGLGWYRNREFIAMWHWYNLTV